MLTIALYFVVIVLIVALAALVKIPHDHQRQHSISSNSNVCNMSGSCNAHTCGAIDPVSDPDYNMRQIVKQSILLEEHLTQDRKRCKDCITKHLLHIQGLAEEAAMLAGDKIKDFPMLSESLDFYDRVLTRWIKEGRDSIPVQLEIATELRKLRKELAATYFLESS